MRIQQNQSPERATAILIPDILINLNTYLEKRCFDYVLPNYLYQAIFAYALSELNSIYICFHRAMPYVDDVAPLGLYKPYFLKVWSLS
ncbi:hypothetical protein CDL62_09055 [Alkalitalea saponilacus]|nr:hypothetical protein CDL62_09055 [Alkalitalea saponilacus]